MRPTTTGALIGSLSGGLLAFYLTRSRPWATIKKVLAVAAGAAGGGALGYGIGKIPMRSHGFSHVGAAYPASGGSGDMLIREAAYETLEQPSAPRRRATGCQRPPDELRGSLLQWTELVQSGKARWQNGRKLASSQDAWEYFRDAALSPQENMYVLSISNSGEPLGHVLVSRGTQTQALVNPVDVLRPLMISGGTRMIIAHNHPSGDPAPSPQDVALTRNIGAAAKELGVTLLDHLVIGRGGYASLRDMGLIR